MSNCIFEFTKDQWDLSILYCAELFSAKPGIVVDVKKHYDVEPIRYYEAAQRSPYFNHRNVRSYEPNKVQIIIECLGVFYAAADNESDRKFLLKQIERTWPKEYLCFKKINNDTIKYIEDDIDLGISESLTPFLVKYLLPTASGDSSRLLSLIRYVQEQLDENLKYINELNTNSEKRRKIPPLTEQDKLLIEMAANPNDLYGYQSGYSHPQPDNSIFLAMTNQNPTLWKKFSSSYKYNYNYLRRTVGWQTFGQISEAFASRGLDLNRFFENNAFSKDLSNEAASFSNILSERATQKWENPDTHFETPPEELNEMVFSPRQFVMFYYMLALLDEYNNLRKQYENLAPEAIALGDNLKQKQVDHLRNEIEELKHQLDAERAKNDTLKAKIAAYQKNDLSAVKKVEARYEEQLRILNEQIRAYEQMKPELERLRNFFFEQNIGADESDVQAVESGKQEEIAKYKIITVGGHEQLRKNIKDAYPSIMVLDGTLKSQDFHAVENADYVFILTQHMSHAVYYNLMKQLERFHVPFAYLSKTNVGLLAKEMLDSLLHENG